MANTQVALSKFLDQLRRFGSTADVGPQGAAGPLGFQSGKNQYGVTYQGDTVAPHDVRALAALTLLSNQAQAGPMRNPFAPPPGAVQPVIPPTFVEQGLPRDARGIPIDPKILAQMDRVRTLRDMGQLVTGGQQAVADFNARKPQGSRSALWG